MYVGFVRDDATRQRIAEVLAKAEIGSRVRIDVPDVKSRAQEEKYHAIIAKISDNYTHFGHKFGKEDMKRLLIDEFKRETENDPNFSDSWAKFGAMRLVPSISGGGVVPIGESSRKFSKKLASAFIEFLQAFCAENNIADE